MHNVLAITGSNCMSFNLKGKNICDNKECSCKIKVFLGLDFSNVTLYIDEDVYIIPLSDSKETKENLLRSLRCLTTEDSNFSGAFLNAHYRDKEDCHLSKRYPVSIIEKEPEGLVLVIVKDCDTICNFIIDFDIIVLIKALERQ